MLKQSDPAVHELIRQERAKQKNTISLIPSENIVSKSVLEATASLFTNKYAEGYPGKRYYGGCVFVDEIETIAVERARQLFAARHANVQPHSGSQANMAAYFCALKPGDKILAMNILSGGHLTHGTPVNFSGVFYRASFYDVDSETGMLDYDAIMEQALKEKPRMIVCGASAYSRIIDFQKLSLIAREIGACMLADIAHIAGLVIAGLHPSPVPVADFTTSTTHKTMRGPRGGLVLCGEEFGRRLDNSIIPGIQGGPLVHIMAAKAVAFKEAMSKSFRNYQEQIINNSRRMCMNLQKRGYNIVSGGTDNHLMVVDLRNKGITGAELQCTLEKVGIITNRNLVPFDPLPPRVTSGIRLGTPLVTSRGMKEPDMDEIVEWIDAALNNRDNDRILKDIALKVRRFANGFPVYA